MKYTLTQGEFSEANIKDKSNSPLAFWKTLCMYKVSRRSSGQRGTSELIVQVYLFPSFYGPTICIFEFKVCGM